MLGFKSKTSKDIDQVVREACDYADVHHFLDPEKTTYTLRRALNHIDDSAELKQSNLLFELLIRGAQLSSDLRSRDLDGYNFERWRTSQLQSIASAKLAIKQGLRSPWRDHYDWLGQSLAHSSVMQSRHARRAYENLAILYRIQNHLLSISDDNKVSQTTKNGYQIEKILKTQSHIQNKSNRLIEYYHSPQVIS